MQAITLESVDYDPFAEAALEHVIQPTAAQKEIWMAARMGKEVSCAFNESISLRLRGELGETALQNAWRQLHEHHESLRATFSPDDGRLCIAAEGQAAFVREDLSTLGPARRDERLRAVLADEVETAFDLENGPLARATLLRLAADDHWLIVTAHHIICDGWSMAVILRDLGRFYSLARAGTSSPPGPSQTFRAYAEWLADQEQAGTQEQARQFWLGKLEANVPVLQLPTDRPRPPVKTTRADRHDHALPPALVGELKKLGAKAGTSFVTVLLAGYAVFLQRLTGQEDLVIGVPSAGQSASGMDSVVGHCVNLLPVRCQVRPAQTFNQLLAQMRGHVLDAYDHQQISFGQLLPRLKLPRDASRTPLVSTVFNLDQAVEAKDLSFSGLAVEFQSNPRHFENFELFINASESGGHVVLECQYNKDLFDDETTRAWLQSFEALLAGAATRPDEAVSGLPMLSQEQQQHILVEWNATALDYPREHTVASLLEEQARRTPDNLAVTFGEQSLSYGELDRRANQLAHHLMARGVGRDMLVGLCLERSLEMIVGMLAILKSGAGYVPLDPKYPRDRLVFMVQDARARLVLTQESCRGLFASETIETLCYEQEAPAIADRPTTSPVCPALPRDPAYVIYTSGSTGTPKGVAVMHANVINLLAAMAKSPGISGNDMMLAVTTLSFDIAVAEILLPLSVGARVALASQREASDGRLLLELMRKSGATIMQGTPATWRLLLQAGWEAGPRLAVWCGGEAMPVDLARALRARATEVWNVYGPTETTVWSTSFLVEDPEVIRLGKPLGNTQAYVLDAHGQPVPVGVFGELYLGGAGVATGYLHRPELTEQRFVANPFHDPFADYPNPKLYRTGDMVRWRHGGMLEYVGRNDHQVKLRGFRIELGEIESALMNHPAVRQAAAVVRTDRPNDPRLVAYIVPAAEAATATELRKHLRQRLPEYMVPQHFVELEQLPLTNNGKVDRGRLPPPFAVPSDDPQPRDLTFAQKYVLRVCKEILGVPTVAITDNFFQAGGHSLLAFEMLARLEKETGARLAPSVLIIDTLAQVADSLPADRVPKG